MRKSVFAASAAAGYFVRVAPLPPPMRYAKVRFLGEVTVILNARLSDKAMARAIRAANAAPIGAQSAMVKG